MHLYSIFSQLNFYVPYSFHACFPDFFLWNKVLANGRNVYCKHCGIYIKNNAYYINICTDETKSLNPCTHNQWKNSCLSILLFRCIKNVTHKLRTMLIRESINYNHEICNQTINILQISINRKWGLTIDAIDFLQPP